MDTKTLLNNPNARVALVVNAGARRGRDALAACRDHLVAAGLDNLDVYPVASGAELIGTLDHVIASRPDLLIVGGGDGSIGAAAHRVAHTDIVLGVLPLGTANDFARTLEFSADPICAISEMLNGKVVDVDLGRANDHTFLNVASFGLSVGVTERLTPGLKRRLGPAAYPAATLRAYRHHRPFGVWLDFPDGDHPPVVIDDLLQVAIGSGRHYGGGNTVSPTASVDDGLLDVYAIVRGRIRDHVSIARLLKDGSFIEHDRVHHFTTRTVRVTTDRNMPINLDGEIAGRTPAEFTVARNALHVVVPALSRAARLEAHPALRVA